MVLFFPDAPCRTYAVFASDGADTKSGLNEDSCIEHGGIKIVIEDSQGLKGSDARWKVPKNHFFN